MLCTSIKSVGQGYTVLNNKNNRVISICITYYSYKTLQKSVKPLLYSLINLQNIHLMSWISLLSMFCLLLIFINKALYKQHKNRMGSVGK